MFLRSALLSTLFAFTACSSIQNEGPLLEGGKADELSKTIAYGVTATGSVSGEAFMLYRLTSVEDGDRFEVEVTRTSGNFDPRSVAYDIGLDQIGHEPGSFVLTGDGNVKTFSNENSDLSFLAVRANSFQGSGEFSVTLRCISGPCAQATAPLSENTELGICMTRARECALANLETDAPVDSDEAMDIILDCLEGDTAFVSCATACDVTGPDELCELMADSLVFYGEQDETCREYLGDCLDSCTESEEFSPHLDLDPNDFEFFMTGEASCWNNEFGDSCDVVARQHEDCGGTEFRDVDGVPTAGTCFAEWRATEGAWLEFEDDNIDCFDTCIAAEDACDAQCSTDSCFDTCIEDSPLLADDDHSVCM